MAYERLFEKLTKENLWIYILCMLRDRPDYALSLRRRIKDRFDFRPAKITFYFVLYRMESEGLVTSRRQQGRRLYTTTPKGKQSLEKAVGLLSDTVKSLEL